LQKIRAPSTATSKIPPEPLTSSTFAPKRFFSSAARPAARGS
jgi:hypothetical protein